MGAFSNSKELATFTFVTFVLVLGATGKSNVFFGAH